MNSKIQEKLQRSICAGWLLILGLLAPTAKAVVFYSTADANYNTTAPSVAGTPSDAGWQWVGYWGSFQGCPISAHHFIAANHIGGSVGDIFTYQGANYTTVNTYVDSASDLRIWEVRETFPSWASLYRSTNETGRTLTVFGRGITRGTEVRTAVATSNVTAGSLAGWYWGSYDGKLRWGQNTVAGFATHPTFGQQLVATFDQGGGSNECHLGVYDSSAPVFINDGTSWKIAGVAGLVEGGFSTTSTGSTFNAFIFDERGLYLGGTQITSTSARPSAFYATRISPRLAWVDGILAQALTATVTIGNLNQTYDGSPRAATISTAPSGLSVTVTYDGSTTAPTNAGSYAVSATASGGADGYTYSGSASGTLTIGKASQTIVFAALPIVSLGNPAFTLTATASSGFPVTYTSSNPAVATVSGATVNIVGLGTTTITANQAGDSNYNSAPSASQPLTVEVSANTASDVPSLPPWAIALLATVLFAFGSRHLKQNSSGDTS